MRCYNLGSEYKVSVSGADIELFMDTWPCSGLGGLSSVSFLFDKRTGDLTDMYVANGQPEDWDGPALLALSQDAQAYGQKRIKRQAHPAAQQQRQND